MINSNLINAGKIICVKKTPEFELKDTDKQSEILNSTLGDYFIDEYGSIVHAP